MSKIYIESGTYIVEIEGYNGSSMTNMRVAEVSAPNTWYTFGSVALEAPNPEFDGAYIGTHDHKFVGFGANEAAWAGNNFIIFTPTNLQDGQSITSDSLLLTSGWGWISSTGFIATDVKSEVTYNLAGQWSFDSDGSPTVGSDTFTAANGATFASDSGRDAAYFPNQNSGFYNNSYIDLPNSYTLSFWFKDLKSRASAQSNFLMAVAYNKETNGAGGYSNWDYDTSYDVAIYTNDELGAYGYANTSAGSNTHNSTGHQMTQALYNGTGWHHMAVVHESGQSTYYINGVQVGVPVSTTGMDKIQTIGSYTNFDYGAFDYMDDFRVYSMALDASQVSDLYNATIVTPVADPTISIASNTVQIDLASEIVPTIELNGNSLDAPGNGPVFVWQWNYDSNLNQVGTTWNQFDASNTPANLEPSPSFANISFRAGIKVNGVYYYSNEIIMPDLMPTIVIDNDPASLSLGDTVTVTMDLKGAVIGDFSWRSGEDWVGGEPSGYVIAGSDTQKVIEARMVLHRSGDIYDGLGTYTTTVTVPDLAANLVPVQKNGYYPLFLTEAEANLWSAGNGSSHIHVFDSTTYYMPNGLTMGVDQFHGDYGQVAQYDLDSDAAASVGSVNGTATNVSFGSDVGRDYAIFDGSGSKIDLGQSSNMGIGGTDDFTVSAWIRPDTLNMTSGQIFGTVVTGATSPQYAGFQLYIANGVLKFMIGGNGYDTISYTLPAGLEYIWSHFAVSRSGTEVKMYMNGALVHTGTTSAVHNITTSHTGHLYAIGSYYSPYNNTWYTGFEGGIDDLRVHNRAMDADEVAYWHTETTVAAPAPDPSISIALPASQVYGESFIQTLDLQGATEYNVNWEFNGPEGWTSISDVNADKLVPWQYDYYEVRALLVIAEVPYYSNVVDPSEFFPRYSWVSDVTSASLGDTLTLSIDLKGYVATAANPIGYVRNTSFASTNYDDSRYHGEFTYVSQVGEILTYTVELTADLHQRYLSPTVNMAPNANVASFYALGESGAYHGPNVMAPDLSGDLVPLTKYGYSPLFLTEAEANLWPAGDDTSHSHSLGGVTYYMPNGLTMGVDQFHGDYGLVLKHDCDDASADVGSSNATLAGVTSETILGRNAWSFSGQSSTVVLDSNKPSFSANSSWTLSMWFYNLKPTGTFRTAARSAATPDIPIMIENTSTNLGAYKHNVGFIDSGFDMAHTEYTGWHHIAAVGEGSSIKYYVNGSLVGTASTNHAWDLASIGNYQYSSYNQQFADAISDVRVWDRTLDADEVAYWHTATTVADPNGPQTLSVEQFDSFGDGWNGGSLNITDANGNSVFSTTGPANGVKAPAGLTESMTLDNDATYSYTVTPGQYPSEVTWSIKDAANATLVSWANGDSVTGSFTLGTPPMYPGMSGTYSFPIAAGTIEFTNMQSNADGISAGATQWAYSLSSLGDVGQAHGGTAVDFGNLTLSNLPEQQSLTLYYGLIDASGLVIWSSSLAGDTREKVEHTLFLWDAYGDGWDGTYFEVYDSNGATAYSTTRPVAQFDNDGDGDIDLEDGKYGFPFNVNLAAGDYTWALVGGSYPEEHSFTFTRDADSLSLASSTASDPISGSFTVAVYVAPAGGAYDWTHGGQLTNIVKFSRGVDALGNPSYAYAKKEDNGTSTIFLTTDISDFAQFSSNATGATGIIGSPVCMEYGSGKLFMGTSTGNAYEIGFDGNTITSVLELHAMAGGESVREAKYDSIQNQWIFEAGEKIFTVVPGTTTAVERYVLPAGAKCMDIAAGDSGVAIIIKKADHSLSPIIATAGWTEISDETAMVASLNALGVADFNYDYVMDKWVAASASGQVLLADDLLQFLGGSGSPPLPG